MKAYFRVSRLDITKYAQFIGHYITSIYRYIVKQLSAYGGCLGSQRRRRTWKSAKSVGELTTRVIAYDVRMGKPNYREVIICI